MIFIITYSNFKTRKIYTSNIHHMFKNVETETSSEATSDMISNFKSNDNIYKNKYKNKYKIHRTGYQKVDRSFHLSQDIQKYIDDNGYVNYKIELIPQTNTKKHSDMELLINNICNTLFINILESDVINNKLTVRIDHDKMKSFNDVSVPNIDIEIQIYDTTNIFDHIINTNLIDTKTHG